MGDQKRNGNGNGNGQRSDSVKRSDFAKDPRRYVDQAREHGPVTVTDGRGRPRIMIVVPKAIEPYPTD